MQHDSIPTDLPEASASANTNPIPASTITEGTVPPTDGAAVPASTPVAVENPAQERAKLRTRKRSEMVGDLMSKIDVIIYVELVQLYYMDCSLFRFLIRLIPQWIFLTPKPPPVPQHKPYIGGIIIPNIICMLLHILTARSEAGEAMRFYLHGGVIPDFIGQKSPTSKLVLFGLDILVLVLQCVMLAVHVEKERLRDVMKNFSSSVVAPTAGAEEARTEVVTAQDHDAEERGVIRDEVMTTSNGDIELQPLSPHPRGPLHIETIDEERNEERERLLAEPLPRPEDEDEHAADIFYSGTVILADFHVLDTLRRQWATYGTATESAIQSVGYSAGFAAVTANRRLGARFQRGVDALARG